MHSCQKCVQQATAVSIRQKVSAAHNVDNGLVFAAPMGADEYHVELRIKIKLA